MLVFVVNAIPMCMRALYRGAIVLINAPMRFFPVLINANHSFTHSKSPAETGDNRVKASALKKLIQLVLSGERLPNLLMTIIRFVMPSRDHQIKKLLLIFWEIWPKTSPDGKLLHEMILVCDAYRKVGTLLALEQWTQLQACLVLLPILSGSPAPQ